MSGIIETLHLDIDKVIACGLIVNKLVINSLKYIFECYQKGKTDVVLRKTNVNETKLVIKDITAFHGFWNATWRLFP